MLDTTSHQVVFQIQDIAQQPPRGCPCLMGDTAMEAWMKALENDGQSETGDQEDEIIQELELIEPSHAQVEQTERAENKLFTFSDAQLMPC